MVPFLYLCLSSRRFFINFRIFFPLSPLLLVHSKNLYFSGESCICLCHLSKLLSAAFFFMSSQISSVLFSLLCIFYLSYKLLINSYYVVMFPLSLLSFRVVSYISFNLFWDARYLKSGTRIVAASLSTFQFEHTFLVRGRYDFCIFQFWSYHCGKILFNISLPK